MITTRIIKYCAILRLKTHIFSKQKPRFYAFLPFKGGQIQKIMNIEGFKGFQGVKNAYISSVNGFTHETIVILSSYMHKSPI